MKLKLTTFDLNYVYVYYTYKGYYTEDKLYLLPYGTRKDFPLWPLAQLFFTI